MKKGQKGQSLEERVYALMESARLRGRLEVVGELMRDAERLGFYDVVRLYAFCGREIDAQKKARRNG